MNRAYGFVLLAALLWGTTGTAQAFAPAAASPLAIGAVRLTVGSLVLLLWSGRHGRHPNGRRWPMRWLLFAAAAMAGYQPFFFAAVANTGVAVGTMVAIGSAPIVAGLGQWLVWGQRPSAHWLLATTSAIIGAVLLALSGGDVAVDINGILLAVGAGSCYALFALASKPLLQIGPPDRVTAVTFALAALFLLPIWWLQDMAWLLTGQGMLVALELGVITTAVAYLLYARGLLGVSLATAVTLTLAEPLTATLLGIFLLGETVTGPVLLGIGFIFAGLFILATQKEPAR